ncbi:MAG: stage III sporulation protein AB [Clostridia bacterium]|nr:stage III sporulation protein AB [Clostridia bacterium]
MLKIAAAVLIAAAFGSAGRYYAYLEKKRVQTLREVLMMISVTQTRLKFSRLPVSELLKSLSENSALSGLGFLKTCRELLSFGDSFSSAWKKSLDQSFEMKKLLPEAYENLLVLGDEIGATDLEGQLSQCEYYKKLFEGILEEREEKSKKSARLFPSLGLLLGISAALFII